ncbi:MAG: UvrD-helicase domain-containing protein, partial [Thiotrichales bacterium]|nr:UvrD-helicase domain-containing protein [Thiotrichales bacterium]
MGIFTIEMAVFQELQQSLQVDASLEDGQARFDAIHPHQSFIVQAPAGSGKTALLTQRFLSLLTQVEFPEQIVAMTFTKKAQSEMQERIYHALTSALTPLKPDAGIYETNTWLLAKAALDNSDRQGWQLLDNPQRLRIRTLDSMNSSLVQQMPLLSRFGASASVIENPEPLYREAVREALNNPDIADSSATLLEKVNGNLSRAENLLISMLKKRDQWMPLLSRLSGATDKDVFDKGLEQLVNAEFAICHQQLKPIFSFLEKARSILLSIAPENRPEGSDWSLLQALKIDQNLPGWGGYAGWKQLANALLTQKDEIRSGKGLNKNNGFPSSKIAEEKQFKDDMSEVLSELSARNGDDSISAALGLIRSLPDARYTDEQWLGVVNLMSLLKTCAAYLKLAFARAGQTDFIEVAQAASDALGEEDQPTDLAQRLDYQIKHLLIDEFQDTSVSQFSLLKKLVAGWQPDEDRTLFIVGDPMQSIYRFREAEVGNFLEVWQGSLGAVTLSCKNLTVNFRSDAAVVEWVNETFPQVLPPQNEIERGAVTYSASTAKKASDADSQVQTHWAFNRTPAEEVEQIVALIQQRLPQMKPGETIGVLGRSRGHLMPIANALKQQAIAFRAVELEALNERQEIQDAQALTRALLHLSDRPAWLALMRTAAIGLSLADLYVLFGNPKAFRKPVLQQLAEGVPENLSPEGKARLEAALPVLNRAVSQIGHLPWSRLVKETWLALGLAETIESAVALENLEAYWQMLESLAQDRTDVLDFAKLEETMEKLFALPDASVESQQIELMTMHKSKGLEFDTVILPGLGKKPRGDDKPLLSWLNFKSEHTDYLVMAPLDQKGQGSSELVSFIQKFEAEKQEYESGRLLYVATTRAKKQLHLFGSVTVTEKNLDAIAEGKKALEATKKSLLETLWQSEAKAFDALLKDYEFKPDEEDIEQPVPPVSRLSLEAVQLQRHWWNARLESEVSPMLDKTLDKASDIKADNPYEAMSEEDALMITSIGNLVHGVLEQWVETGFLQTEDVASKLQYQSGYFRYWLRQQGLTGDALEKALER